MAGLLDARAWCADLAPDGASADSQIVMGPAVSIAEIPNAGIPVHLLVYSESPVDTARVARLAATAFARVARYFGVVPLVHYTILQELLTPVSPRHNYNFSMEHLDSMTSALAADRALTAQSPAGDELRMQFNLAHHIAHAWVPKRASGAGYFPFQWELAPLIDTIWFAEGFGQYAAIVAIAAGEPDPAVYRERLLERRFRQSIRDAPPFLRRLNLVDLLRGAKSLRDVFTWMLDGHGAAGRSFAVDEFPAIVRAATGVEVGAIYAAALTPLDPQPAARNVSAVGLLFAPAIVAAALKVFAWAAALVGAATRLWRRHPTTCERGGVLLGLVAMAIVQPLFDVVRVSPEFFVARNTTAAAAVTAAALIGLGLPLLLLAIERVLRRVAPPVATMFFMVAAATLLALMIHPWLRRREVAEPWTMAAMATAAGELLAWRVAAMRQFLAALAPAAIAVPCCSLPAPRSADR